ncbi:MAG: hypothetical protein Q8Q09_05185 [Deltaproteobacteria bacterium]|nr:hypothetical protein [Deltaproteobacteria bacterium]
MSGAYPLTGTCSVPGFSPFPIACIAQTGCTASISVLSGTIAGTVVGNQLSFETSVAGTPLSCTATLANGTMAVDCSAAGGAATCMATGMAATFPGATRYCCDASAQNCGAGQHCAIVSESAANATSFTACIPAGTTAAGATCTRMGGRLGADGCGAGLFCSNVGQATATTRVCQKTCGATADCPANNNCVLVTRTPAAGNCSPSCTLQGTDCIGGATCRYRVAVGATGATAAQGRYILACDPVGTVATGMSCQFNSECGPGHACVRNNGGPLTCRPECDTAHPCAAGQTCTLYNDGPANTTGAGFCVPN